jgi:hypothetical protein
VELVDRDRLDHIKLADIGSGPISVATNILNELSIPGQLELFDPLAPTYNQLLDESDLPHLPRIKMSLSELLSQPEGYDVIYARNSLDHSFDAPFAIFNLVDQLRVGGICLLEHYENEALLEKYDGIHHWNFEEVNGEFEIWSPVNRVSVSRLLKTACSVNVLSQREFEKPWLTVRIEKHNNKNFLEGVNRNELENFSRSLSVLQNPEA